MWRIGVTGDEKGKQKSRKKASAQNEKPKQGFKMIAPLPQNVISADANSRRGSIMAAEHLLKRRGSRASKQFNPPELASFAGRDNVAAGAIPLDHLRKDDIKRRRSSVNNRLSKVQEIRDRVHKTVTDYETKTYDDEETTDSAYLLKDIEENLYEIEDDMLRINVGILMDKFRKVSQQAQDNIHRIREIDEGTDKKQEILESLQTWMDEDHFEDFDTDDRLSPLPEDADAMSGSLNQVQQNMKRCAQLSQKINSMKNSGEDTMYLERERSNLEKQVKQDALDSAYERRHSKDAKESNKQEFKYLKNAANEIYDMLNRTRMEGMADSHQFEEQLEKILKIGEEKDKDIEYLEGRLKQEKKLVRIWLSDYEKLQNDHMLTKDEIISLRKSHRRITLELESVRKKFEAAEEKKLQLSKAKANNKDKEALKKAEQHVQLLKQKAEVLNWTVKEKDGTIEDQARTIHQLKSALRKGPSSHNVIVTDGLHKSRSPDNKTPKSQSGRRDSGRQEQISRSTTRDGASHIRVASSLPPPSPSVQSINTELESLKMRIKTLERENRTLKKKKTELETIKETELKKEVSQKKTVSPIPDTKPKTKKEKIISSSIPVSKSKTAKQKQSSKTEPIKCISVEVQTDPISIEQPQVPISVAPTIIKEETKIEMINQEMQTSPRPTLQFMDDKERRRMYELGQQMSQQFGNEWSTVAATLRKLQPEDISEIDHGLACEDDFIRMFSGSPTKGRPVSDASARTAKENEEIEKVRDDILSCRVTTSVQKLAEGMLSGLNPQLLEEQSFDSVNVMHGELEEIQNKITSFVSKAQAMIGCQTVMMNEANETIKRNLPINLQLKLDKIKSKQAKALRQRNASRTEHSQEWKDMSVTEQIRCQIKLIEENMRGSVSKTMNVFVNELAKQHAEYNDIHTSIGDEANLNVAKLVSSPNWTVMDIQNKVESSVRQMARVTRAERGVTTPLTKYDTSMQAMGEGLVVTPVFGGEKRLGMRKSVRTYTALPSERPSPAFSLLGHAPEGSVILNKPATTTRRPAHAKTQQAKQMGSDGIRPMVRQPTRDLHLLRLRRTKVKSDMAKSRGLGMAIKNTQGPKEMSPIIGSQQRYAKRNQIPLTPLITSTNVPKTSFYPETRSVHRPLTVANEGFGLTFSDIQSKITEQIPAPPRLRRPTLLIDRSHSMPVEGSSDDLNLVISNLGLMGPSPNPAQNVLPHLAFCACLK